MKIKKQLIVEIVSGENDELKPSDLFEVERDFCIMLKEAYNKEF